jgi:trimeric autotransporter adhesin
VTGGKPSLFVVPSAPNMKKVPALSPRQAPSILAKLDTMKITTLSYFIVALALLSLSFSPKAQAVNPPPDGCYPNLTTAEGCDALNSLSTGAGDTALGWRSLFSNSTGSFNTGVGVGALVLNDADSNTAIGAAALLLNTTGTRNTAIGTATLVNNAADDNTATGAFALTANTTGGTLETSVEGFDLGPNTAVGSGALEMNVDSSANTAVGYNALRNQVTGVVLLGDPHLAANTAIGFEALVNLTGTASGGNNAINTALGYQALADFTDGQANVAVGGRAGTGFPDGSGLTAGDANTFVGYAAGDGFTSGSFNIFIGFGQGPASAAETSHTYIGNINNTSVSGGGTDTVTIDLSTGLLGHLSSSRRYKEDINPMDKASEALYRLKPVTYRYKKEIDKTQSLAFGLIAEEVAEVNPHLVAHNGQGQPESVHYEMVNAMLLNEFLKEHKKVEEQQINITQLNSKLANQAATIAQQQKVMEVFTAQLKEQAAQIQKVSAQLEMSKPAPQVVANKP